MTLDGTGYDVLHSLDAASGYARGPLISVAGVPWVHLDIAGPAWAERENAARASGGTGAFVRTLIELAHLS